MSRKGLEAEIRLGNRQRTLASPIVSKQERRRFVGAFLVAALLILTGAIKSKGAEPSPKTLKGWDAYVQTQNARVNASGLSGPLGKIMVTTQECVRRFFPSRRALLSAHKRESRPGGTMKLGYWVVTYRSVSDQTAVKAYAALAVPAVESLGGRFLTRSTSRIEAHEAGSQQRTILVEFDSYDIAVAAYQSETYQQALRALSSGAQRDFRIVEGA